MVTNNIEIVANLLVAFGTILLALASYKSIRIVKKQTELMYSQSNFMRLQQTPLLKREDLKINENNISIKLTNIGNGIATQIGVDTSYYVVSPKLVEPPDERVKEKVLREQGISKDEYASITSVFGREMWFKYNWTPNSELFKEVRSKEIFGLRLGFLKDTSKAYPENYITFVKNDVNETSILEEGESSIFNCTPQMGLKIGETYLMGRKHPKYLQWISFDKLVSLCKENNIQYLGFKIDLIYKDLAENVNSAEELINCVVDINADKTLEDAFKKNVELDIFPLGQSEIENKIGGCFKYFYELKSSLNYINPFKD